MRRSKDPHAVQWFKERTQENDRLLSDSRNVCGLYRRLLLSIFLSNKRVSEIADDFILLHNISCLIWSLEWLSLP